jgi:hypothetical protein
MGSIRLAGGGSGPATGEWSGTVVDSAGIQIVRNPATGIWRPGETPSPEVVLRIGEIDGEPEYQFGRITGINVDEEGHLYVGDSQAREARVFDASGVFLRKIGRPGSGPGELGPAGTSILVGRGDTLFLPDPGQQRVNIFLRDGSFVRSFPIPMMEGMSVKWVATEEGDLLQQVRRMPLPGIEQDDGPDVVIRRGSDGAIRDTVLILAGGMKVRYTSGGAAPMMTLFEPESAWDLMRDGRLLLALNSNYRIDVRSPAGEVERVIHKTFVRQEFGASDRELFLAVIREAFEKQGIPPAARQMVMQGISFADYYPAFMTFMEGPEGSLWVQQIVSAKEIAANGGTFSPEDDLGAPEWDVFDRDGRFLGIVTLPPRFQPRVVRENRIYGVQKDELDVPYVMVVEVGGALSGG